VIAQLLVHLAFGLAVATAVGYSMRALFPSSTAVNTARALYYILVLTVMALSAILFYAIATHNFDFTYVQSYTSRQLEPPFLYAAFYSGQEGSFLLWTLLVCFVGIAVIEYSRRHNIEAETMAFYSLVLVFLTLMLVAKNPFTFLWETYAQEGTTKEFIEALKVDPSRYNGRGLNPVLQNYWVMIHPPMLFSGFAMMTAPFAFAMAGLWRRQYHQWTRLAQPWMLAATVVLGVGIVLGGFWAYETLGWGGFWAWDPVENSSLVPWLFAATLLHTTLIQRRTSGLVRTNFLLMIAAFAAVLYSTFLTRSGVLGDTSVHSFVEPGYFVYVLLLAFLLTFIALGIALLVLRYRDIRASSKRLGMFSVSSREFVLALGSACLLVSAGIVLLGTSYPIIAEVIGKPKAAIEPNFYNTLHLPLAAVILLANGLSLVATWSATNKQTLLRGTLRAFIIALVLAGVSYASGLIPTWYPAAVIAAALFALVINLQHIVRLIRARKPIALGAYLAHAGLALLVVGIIQLAYTSKSDHLRLVEGKAASLFGYKFTLLGREHLDQHLSDREKFRYVVAVEKNNTTHYAYPVVYYSDFNQRQAPFLEPGIIRHLSHDVYIAPKALDVEESSPTITLSKQTSVPFPLNSRWTLTLLGYDMSQAQQSDIPGALKLGARIELRSSNSTILDTTLYTYFDGQSFVPKPIALDTLTLSLVRIQRNQDNPERSTATIRISTPSTQPNTPRQVLVVDASIKPMINLVWCGFLVMLGGVLLSTVRAFRSQAIIQPPAKQPAPSATVTAVEQVPQSALHKPPQD